MSAIVRSSPRSYIFGVLLAGAVAACSPTGFAVNVAGAVTEGRSIHDQARDAEIMIAISKAVFDIDSELFRAVGFQVWEGRVLLTGAVAVPEHKERVISIAKSTPGAKAVIDEMQVAPKESLGEFLGDAVIEERLKARLLMADGVISANYSLRAVKGAVYLLGSARSPEEADIVIHEARTIGSVTRVVSYIKVRERRT